MLALAKTAHHRPRIDARASSVLFQRIRDFAKASRAHPFKHGSPRRVAANARNDHWFHVRTLRRAPGSLRMLVLVSCLALQARERGDVRFDERGCWRNLSTDFGDGC